MCWAVGNRECSADIMCCRYSLDGSHLAVGLCDGSIKVRQSANYNYSVMSKRNNAIEQVGPGGNFTLI